MTTDKDTCVSQSEALSMEESKSDSFDCQYHLSRDRLVKCLPKPISGADFLDMFSGDYEKDPESIPLVANGFPGLSAAGILGGIGNPDSG